MQENILKGKKSMRKQNMYGKDIEGFFNEDLLVKKILSGSEQKLETLLQLPVSEIESGDVETRIREMLRGLPDEEYQKYEKEYGIASLRVNIPIERWCDGFGDVCYNGDYTIREDELPPALQYALHNVWEENPEGNHCCIATFQKRPYIALTHYYDEDYADSMGCSMEDIWYKGVLKNALQITQGKYISKICYVIANRALDDENVVNEHELIILLSPYLSKQEFHQIAKYFSEQSRNIEAGKFYDTNGNYRSWKQYLDGGYVEE